MVGKRGLVLGEQRLTQAGITDNDRGFELVAKPAQVFFLVFVKIHGREV
jgi:hypothetical protein